ncbi:MAG: exodeoxyribonuclease VII large subunit, partial [Actinomycetes bacterium]
MTLETSQENPAPLHVINESVAAWIARLGAVWVEGQITGINRRNGASQVYIQLRDIEKNVSVTVVTSPGVINAVEPALADGARIVLHAKPEFWTNRGTFALRARVIAAVGLGDLLARVERLKAQLGAEGLFHESRKRKLPFLPRRIGLICGRDSAAERDVVENTIRRWPAAQFVIREVAVQGTTAASAVTAALTELEAIADVDVIVITRGGGSAEDLLPFSDEQLVRTAAACTTPLVSAIGHEQDAPLLD